MAQRIFLVLSIVLLGIFAYVVTQLLRTPQSANAAPQPVGQPDGWDLIFSDDFTTSSLDTAKWTTCYPWSGSDDGCAHGQELQWYLPANVNVGTEVASLSAKKESIVGSDGKSYAYTSGMISTGINKWDTTLPAKFAFQYGFVEMRAKVPSGQGLWPAFWLLPFNQQDPGKWPPEIDVMEILGNDPTTVHMFFHYRDSQGSEKSSGGSYTGPDYSADYHTYGLSWQPDGIRWFIDGVESRPAFTDAQFVPSEPMYLIANLAVGGAWPGAPDANTVFPSKMDIDYIRVWQKAVPTVTLIPPTDTPTPTPTKKPTATPTPADTTPPTVSITQPGNNTTVTRSKNIPLYASATDASGIQKVEFYINGSKKCIDTTPSPYSCIWSVPSPRNVRYQLKAKAFDNKGNTATSTTITVTSK